MKRYFLLFTFIVLFSVSVFSETRLISSAQIGSYFTLLGEVELRNEADFSKPVLYTTLNHEGGLKVMLQEIGQEDSQKGKKGCWINILQVAPMWSSSGEWVPKHHKFWIFLPYDVELFDYEN